MAKLTAIFSFLTLIPIIYAQEVQSKADGLIRGAWVIKSIYHTPNIQGPGVEEQKSLIGSKLVYSGQSLRSCGQAVPIKPIREYQVDSADFLANTRVRFSDVEIKAQRVTEVVLNNRQAGSCLKAFPSPGQDVYLKNKDEILIDFEGVFYRALRMK
jgi:hypothetical protein